MESHVAPKSAKIPRGFPKHLRLLRTAEYRRVYDGGRRRNLGFLLAFALENGKPSSRIGLTVPRTVGGAVVRNLLKRRLREVVRKHLAELEPGWDIVFNARPSAGSVQYAAIEETVAKFFQSCAHVPRRTAPPPIPPQSTPPIPQS